MKIKLSKDQLLKNLTMASDVVSNKNTTSILSNVLITAKNGLLTLSATDNETYIQIKDTAAEIDKDGSVILTAKKLVDIVKNLPKDNMGIKLDDKNVAHISTDSKTTKVKFKLNGASPEGYVSFPEIKDIKKDEFLINLEIPLASDLKKMFYKTIPFISADSIQGILGGVFLNIEKDKTTAVSTDGRKLSCVENKDISSGQDVPIHCVLPEKVVNLFLRIFPDDAKIHMVVSRSLVFFYTDTIQLSSRLIDGTFPDYKTVIPKAFDKNVVVSFGKFSEAVKRVSTIMDTNCLKIVMNFKGKELNMVAENGDVGNAEELIDLESSDFADFKINFSWQILQDAIKIMTKPNIQFMFNADSSATMMKEEGQNNSFAIVMPLRND